jgi:hypothetical protein
VAVLLTTIHKVAPMFEVANLHDTAARGKHNRQTSFPAFLKRSDEFK